MTEMEKKKAEVGRYLKMVEVGKCPKMGEIPDEVEVGRGAPGDGGSRGVPVRRWRSWGGIQ
jgi:hypothetical protein